MMLPSDPSILLLSVFAMGFILLGIFYPLVSDLLGVDEDEPGRRMLSILLGLGIFALLFVYRLAMESMAS